MILKKPYAFFIKHFKLFHLIICILSSILLYRTSLIYRFVLEYIKTTPNVIGKELTDVLFVNWSYILVALIIVVNIIIIVIMIRKQKPYMYYILNISLYVGVLIAYIFSNKVIGNLEVMLVENKTILAMRDILNIARILQTISIIFYLVRATGFDIKKFDFVRDLQSLDISEEDSEEYEVAVEFEKNIVIRNLKRNLRNAKYYYKENKFIINIILLLLIGIIFLLIYLNINKYSRTYEENAYVNVSNMNIGITNSYIIKKDYKKDLLSNKDTIIALVLSVKSNQSQILPSSRLVLSIDGKKYYHTKDYNNSLIDLGITYNEQKLSDEFKEYLLIYKIPTEDINKKMTFKYIDKIEQEKGKTKISSIDIKLKPIDIDEEKTIETNYNLSEEIDTTSNLSTYKLTINNYEISKTFTNTYNSCISDMECYQYKEILTPTVERNTEKVLLKLDGNLSYEKTISNINDLYSFINIFGSIEYTFNGTKKIEKNDFNQLKFAKTKDNNYYIEIDKEIMNADTIKLVFNIRNRRYVYTLKGDINE